MRIVHLAPFYYPIIGGVETAVEKIAEYIASRNHEVYVLTYNRLRRDGIGVLPKEEIINSVRVIRLKPDFMWSHGTYSSELPEILKVLKPDVVHVHGWRHPHVFQVAKLKDELCFKAILHSHAPFHRINQLGIVIWLYHNAVDLIAKSILRVYDKIVALTPHEENILIRKLGVARERVAVVPHGIEDELIAMARNTIGENNSPTVMYIGRISRSKNVDLLLKAMNHVKREQANVKLVLAGPDEGLVNRLGNYMRKHSISFEYLGIVPEVKKYELYSGCKVFAHPAYYEPFGITLLEAQAFGKPCVVTGDGGQLYTAPPNKTSLYAKPNPKDFAEAITQLLTDGKLYRKLSTKAGEWAAKHTWSTILPKYEKLYSDILTCDTAW